MTRGAVFALALVACSCLSYRDLRQATEPPTRDAKALLSPTAVREDLRLLRFALERGYVGSAFVPAPQLERLFDRLQALRLEALDVQHLCDAIGDAFWQLPDGHLGAGLRHPDGRAVLCGTQSQRELREPTVGPRRFAKDARSWHIETQKLDRRQVGVLSIGSFPADTDPVWTGCDAAMDALLRSAEALVIDLRGNPGGDDNPAADLGQRLLDGPVATPTRKSHIRQTPEIVTMLLNRFHRASGRDDGRVEAHSRWMYEALEQLRTALLLGQGEEWTVRPRPHFTAAPGRNAFKGPIAILVDAGCASACESALQFLRLHPRARSFGQRTAGLIHTGNAGLLTLPHSGIRVAIPSRYEEYPEGRNYDKVGLEPDVVVADGKDAFDVARRWLADSR
jgi:hypothetical protein